jgi:hypothetical protein
MHNNEIQLKVSGFHGNTDELVSNLVITVKCVGNKFQTLAFSIFYTKN